MSISTAQILAMKALQRTCGQDCVDWAIGLLEKGISRRNVAILSGMTPPFNPFEMADFRDRVLEDLRVPELSRTDAIMAYVGELATDAVVGEGSPFALLKELSELCVAEGYMRELLNCYLLSNAWEDLLAQNIQWYWQGATLDNIEILARAELARLAGSPRIDGVS